MRTTIFLLSLIFATSCCEPFDILDLKVCVDRVIDNEEPILCRDEDVIFKDQEFTASVELRDMRAHQSILFKLYDRTNNDSIISRLNGGLNDYNSFEPNFCHDIAAHTFELPESGFWPDRMLLEVEVDCYYDTFTMEQELTPL